MIDMALIDKYFKKEDLEKIARTCTEVEKNTSGEIRVSIYNKKPWRLRKKNIFELALYEFYRLGMDKTRDRTGILLFILLNERKFQILADSGINEKVNQEVWDNIASELTSYFKQGKYMEGVVKVVKKMGKVLSRYFPRKPDDINELSDEVSVM